MVLVTMVSDVDGESSRNAFCEGNESSSKLWRTAMKHPVDITVVLCTYNRATSLTKALDSVAVSKVPAPTSWEVLVIDNRSTDTTPSVVDDVSRRYPGRFRYIFEPEPGKSYALNTAIRAARGSILAFMDDDVIVDPNWLQNLTVHLQRGKWVGAGGRIFPAWTSPAPRWLPSNDRYGLAPLVMFDLGPDQGQLHEPPFGTNMAYQRDVFDKYGLFRIDLGPNAKSEIRGEDTEFGRRLLAAKECLRYEPSAVVYHEVSEKRLRKDFFLSFWFDKGRSDVREFGTAANSGKWNIAGVSADAVLHLAIWTVRWLLRFEPRRRFSAKTKTWWRAGEIVECYRISRHVKRRDQLTSPKSEGAS